jgi:hypothetical protein
MSARKNIMQVSCCLSEEKGFEYSCYNILRKDKLQNSSVLFKNRNANCCFQKYGRQYIREFRPT